MKRFLKYFQIIAFILLLLIAAVAVYSYFIEPSRLVVREKNLTLPRWSKELNGFKILLISDIHGGSNYVTEKRLREIVEIANRQNPDLTVILGDNVSQTEGKKSPLKMPIETIVENIKGLKAGYGVYSVIGNHDWWYDESKVRTAFESAGIKVLENETTEISVNNQIITIAGFEDYWKKKSLTEGINKILSDTAAESNVICLTHNPDTFDLVGSSCSVLLAGHTHGGQVWIPFYGPPIVVAKREYTYGHVEKDGKNLYVTSGIGMSGPNFRIGVPPEIVVLTLQSKD